MFVKTNLQFILPVIIHKAGWDSSPLLHNKGGFTPKGKENVPLGFSVNSIFKENV